MYIVGHALTVTGTIVDADELLETGLRALMLPDYADSHSYAYSRAWFADGDPEGRLIRGHIAGDWWIHFGEDISRPAVRRGWAYKRMGTIVEYYQEFYTRAYELGLSHSSIPNDSKRGWAHSFVEYSVDAYICRYMFDDRLYQAVRDQLGDIAGHMGEVKSLFATQSVNDPNNTQWTSALDYSRHVSLASTAEQYSTLGLVRKFGLVPSSASIAFVEHYINIIIERIGRPEFDDVVQSICRFVYEVENLGVRPAIPGGPREL